MRSLIGEAPYGTSLTPYGARVDGRRRNRGKVECPNGQYECRGRWRQLRERTRCSGDATEEWRARRAASVIVSTFVNVYQAAVERLARTRLGARILIPFATAIDRRVIRWTSGKVSTGLWTTHKDNVILLHVRGAKTGQLRTVPLLATPIDDALVVIASNGGATIHPAWYRNLKKNPDCQVTVQGAKSPRIAREASGEERVRLWQAAVLLYPGYERYAERAERDIPVMILERR